jgi:folate-binding protein YgfZ
LIDAEEQTCLEYESDRIEAGIPEGENEFNDNINPMECGLERYISFNKGCYIGQEVIARLDSQGKLPKRMIRVNSDKPLQRNEKIFLIEEDKEEIKEVGFVSSTVSYDAKNLSLGFIRSVYLDSEKGYIAGSSEKPDKNVKIKISIIN